MIVVEKTRDIGVLKSLGASSRGILGIFLSYGLSLKSVVGARGGPWRLACSTVRYINQVRDILWSGPPDARCSTPRSITSIRIPTIVNPFTVGWIVLERIGDCRAGQRFAGDARRAIAPSGGTAL